MTAENGIALGNDVIDSTAQHPRPRPRGRPRGADHRGAHRRPGAALPVRRTTPRTSAITGANTAAETYLRVREDIYKQQRAALMLSYDNTIKSVTDAAAGRAEGSARTSPAGSDTLSPRTQALLDQVSALNDQIAQLANAARQGRLGRPEPRLDHRRGPRTGAVQPRRRALLYRRSAAPRRRCCSA